MKGNKMYTWEELENFIKNCHLCPLYSTRKQAVMGKGNHNADIMFIAEAPGAKEDEEGIPFVGPSGRLFDQLLEECGLTREEIYISNILKCHPPRNRDPQEKEKEKCLPYLRYETFLLKPKIIVCLGRVAAQKIIAPDFRITKQHGTWTYRKKCALTAVYHPSALLRNADKIEPTKMDFLEIVRKREELNSSMEKIEHENDKKKTEQITFL